MILPPGRLRIVLSEIPMFTTPVYVLHPFGRQLPLREAEQAEIAQLKREVIRLKAGNDALQAGLNRRGNNLLRLVRTVGAIFATECWRATTRDRSSV